MSLLKVAGKHPNVVSLQAFFEDQEAFYIVMEMCEGGELYHRLADKVRVCFVLVEKGVPFLCAAAVAEQAFHAVEKVVASSRCLHPGRRVARVACT